jgi:glyceraldehyde 3-phosphate dehydrogenase
MAHRIAINGFGRIGRLVFRAIYNDPDFDVLCINDVADPESLAYLLKYDSVHGQFPEEVAADGNFILIGKKRIQVFMEHDASNLPLKELSIDIAIEATGLFTKVEDANRLRAAGAQLVIITAPSSNAQMFCMGVNHTLYNPEEHKVVSNASCTTNCLAPMAKVLHDNFGIVEGLMTTIHAITATQKTTDSPSGKDKRGGRAAATNIIPASTGAAKAVGQVLPELKGKLTGTAFRVPVLNGSVVDLTVRLEKRTSYAEICRAMKEASEGHLTGILDYTEDPIVSSDIIGNAHSCIFDSSAGLELNSHFYKLIGWYDNEWGYSSRVVDLVRYIANAK